MKTIEFDVGKTLHGTGGNLELAVRGTLSAGSFNALFGPSGAGKTTLLRILAGLAVPDRGVISVGGETWFDAARRINLPPQQRSIGFVFQDYALFPNLTVRENIAYAASKADRSWIDHLLALADLKALQERKPDSLSGGQKQRVALARAIARQPVLLLLDEPLSALDSALRAQLQDDLARLQGELGFTVLLITHDLGELFRLAQHVFCLEQGRITRTGTPAQVFLHERAAGMLDLHGRVLDIRAEEVVYVLVLLIGQNIIQVLASRDEVEHLKPGDTVLVSTRTFSPMLMKQE